MNNALQIITMSNILLAKVLTINKVLIVAPHQWQNIGDFLSIFNIFQSLYNKCIILHNGKKIIFKRKDLTKSMTFLFKLFVLAAKLFFFLKKFLEVTQICKSEKSDDCVLEVFFIVSGFHTIQGFLRTHLKTTRLVSRIP